MTKEFVDMTGKVMMNWKNGMHRKRNTITQSRMVDQKI